MLHAMTTSNDKIKTDTFIAILSIKTLITNNIQFIPNRIIYPIFGIYKQYYLIWCVTCKLRQKAYMYNIVHVI